MNRELSITKKRVNSVFLIIMVLFITASNLSISNTSKRLRIKSGRNSAMRQDLEKQLGIFW
jgi:hypothetical protein